MTYPLSWSIATHAQLLVHADAKQVFHNADLCVIPAQVSPILPAPFADNLLHQPELMTMVYHTDFTQSSSLSQMSFIQFYIVPNLA